MTLTQGHFGQGQGHEQFKIHVRFISFKWINIRISYFTQDF